MSTTGRAEAPFPLRQWLTPEINGLRRVPMTSAMVPQAESESESNWVRSLDGRWRFRLVESPDAVDQTMVTGDCGAWAETPVPGSWVLDGYGAPVYLNVRMPFREHPPDVPPDNPTGVYRRQFTVPREWRRRRTFLRIGSADSMAWLWVNGEFVGLGKDSRLASTFEITTTLRPGSNEVCLVVPQWSDATWIEDQDQWWLPGVHRSIELISEPNVRIADAALVPGLAADGATGLLHIEVEVDLGGDDMGQDGPVVTVEVMIDDGGGRIAQLEPTPVPRFPFGNAFGENAVSYTWPGHRVVAELAVPSITPWTHETPALYSATVVARHADGTVLDRRTRRVGFRRVEVADNELRINGTPVVINGTNRHEAHPDRGRVISADDVRADLVLMKRHHINAVRTSHYPDGELLYDLCDELGLYVIDEANIESHGRWRAVAEDSRYAGSFLDRGLRMVLRDRSHPCVIAWSLGNESGYGPNHDAMAAWIRRADPSRVLHYEGALNGDLDAAAPVTDIVCPMYSPPDAIAQWAERSADPRRPLILCEYGHAMGQAGGLDDYWALFGRRAGLQGGFVWEWCDHGLRRREPDGTEWFAYGGDFGEEIHDGSFVCDGLVSPDREPHPMLLDLAALSQPVAVSRRRDGSLRIENRQWFTTLASFRASWTLEIDGRRVGRGVLTLPEIGPQGSALVPSPVSSADATGGDEATLIIEVFTRRATSWAPRGWPAAICQVVVPTGPSPAPGPRRRRRAAGVAVEITDGGLTFDGHIVDFPALSLWRPPTDNDDPPGEWRPQPSAAQRWRGWGLDALDVVDVDVRRVRNGLVRIVSYEITAGTVRHEQRVEASSGVVSFREQADVPVACDDLPRVGVTFELPRGFEDLEWLGLGPGDTYPDRRAASRLGHWTAQVRDQRLPFVVPQEFGLHLDTRWFTIGDGATALTVAPARPAAFSALPHTAAQLTAARHAHQLETSAETVVHLDAAHRGLGTAACGPDTAVRWRVPGGIHRWRWSISAESAVSRGRRR